MINGVPIKIGQKKIKNTDTSFRFLSGEKAVTFFVPENLEVAYVDGKTSYLIYDFDSGILSFQKSKYPIDIKLIDVLITKNAIAGIFNRLKGALEKDSITGAIFKYLVCLGLGLAVGGIIGYYIANQSQAPKTAMVILNWLL